MVASLRRTCFVLSFILLFCASVVGATTYYVRTDGSDSACSGLVDAAAGVDDPNCAFATVQNCVNQTNWCSTDGRCQIGAGTFPGMVTLPDPCRGTSGHPWILDGAGRTDTIIDPADTSEQSGIRFGGQYDTTNATQFGVISDMQVNAGFQSAISCHYYLTQNHGVCNNITIQRVDFRDFGNMVRHSAEGTGGLTVPDSIIVFSRPPTSVGGAASGLHADILIDDILLDGDQADECFNLGGTSGIHFCGSDAPGIYANTSYVTISNSTFQDSLGQVARLGDHSIFEGNTVSHMMCDGDDGCIQVYNGNEVIIRRNLFYHSSPSGAAAEALSVVKCRRTNTSQPETDCHVYNNTFIGEGVNGWGSHSTNTVCSGTTSSCPANSMGTGIKRRAFSVTNPDSHPTPWGQLDLVRNIFVNYIGPAGGSMGVNINPGDPSSCPSPTYLRGNIYFNNQDSVHDPQACIDNWAAPDDDPSVEFEREPGLNRTTLAPSSYLSNACNPAGSGYTAWDDDTADSWAGYTAGSCVYCGDGTRNNNEECDGTDLAGFNTNCTDIPPPYGWCASSTLSCNANCTFNVNQCVNCGPTPVTCRNGAKDGLETDVDCGGAGGCNKCGVGQDCLVNSDCSTTFGPAGGKPRPGLCNPETCFDPGLSLTCAREPCGEEP